MEGLGGWDVYCTDGRKSKVAKSGSEFRHKNKTFWTQNMPPEKDLACLYPVNTKFSIDNNELKLVQNTTYIKYITQNDTQQHI